MSLNTVELLRLFRMALCFAMLSASASYLCAVFSEKKWSFRLFRDVLLYHIVIITCSMLSNQSTTIMPIVTFSCYSLFLFFYCKLRGTQWFKAVFIGVFLSTAGDLLAGLCAIYLYRFDADTLALARHGYSPVCYVINLTCAVFTISFTACYSQLSKSKKQHPSFESLFRALRPLLMVVCLLTLFLRTMQRTESLAYVERFPVVFPEFLVIVLLFGLGGSYAVQDIKYLRQTQLNSNLLQQKAAQDALLKETRIFRHNIANLLYGFQGILLSGDRQSIQEYYANLVNTCALVNNENIVSLQRIPSMAVSALLLNKIQSANDKKIPFYLCADEGLIYRGLKDQEMCEIMGILLDNALESASECPAPLITVEFHNVKNEMEIVVRNTFDERAIHYLDDDILISTVSSKEGHAGIGLSTVQKAIEKSDRSLFNIYRRGRYVEASLLFCER